MNARAGECGLVVMWDSRGRWGCGAHTRESRKWAVGRSVGRVIRARGDSRARGGAVARWRGGAVERWCGGVAPRAMSVSVVLDAGTRRAFEEDSTTITRDAARAYGVSALQFVDVRVALRRRDGSERVILDACSGSCEAGEMVAVMGPSGCGKTTLLDCLANKKTQAYEGDVRLNGTPRDALFSRLTSYVPQMDDVPAYLTVGEAVRFVHALRVEGRVSERERDEATRETLRLLGIDDIENEIIGDEQRRGISGGQKRRLSLARGLIGGSQIVFSDEPTSGLSATDAYVVTRAMSVAAKTLGVLFITVIHQPRAEVTDMFDSLILLTSNPGRLVYNGPFRDAVKYVEAAGFGAPKACNPADFLLDLITPGAYGEQSNALAQRYIEVQKPVVDARLRASLAAPKKSAFEILREVYAIQGIDQSQLHEKPIAASFATQFRTLLGRELAMVLRNKTELKIRYGTALFQGLIVGMAFYNIASREPILQLSFYFMILQMGTISNMAILPKLINARFVYKLEISDSLFGEAACICVNTLVNSALAISSNFITTILLFSFSRLPWSAFGTLYFWSLLSFIVVTGYLRVIAQLAKSGDVALQTAMPFLLTTILFNNFFISRASGTFLKFLIYVSPMAWAVEQIATSIYSNDVQMLQLYEYKTSDSWTTVAACVLIAEACFFQVLEFIALKKNKSFDK